MKKLLILLTFTFALFTVNAQSGLNPFINAAHYQTPSNKFIPINYVWSQTNRDSAFFADSGRVSTLAADSVGDSLFFLYRVIPGIGSTINVGFLADTKGDTLCDSVFIYQNTYQLLGKAKMANTTGATFGIAVSPVMQNSQPELLTIKSKWKHKAGKGAHFVRCRFNFLQGN